MFSLVPTGLHRFLAPGGNKDSVPHKREAKAPGLCRGSTTPPEPKHNGCIAILTFTLLPQVLGTMFEKSYMVIFAAHKP